MTKLSKRKIETLKSFLTKEEANEIVPLVKKYYGSYYRGTLILKDDASASSIIYWGFRWTETSEGHHYWHYIRAQVIERELEIQKNNLI